MIKKTIYQKFNLIETMIGKVMEKKYLKSFEFQFLDSLFLKLQVTKPN